jgi:hypothetical protein
MGGGPSIPAPPPPPDPERVAEANAKAYRMNVDTYIEKLPEMTAVENKMRMQYMPQQRELERQLSALDQLASVRSGLEAERMYGPQRSTETLRRQFELSPQGYALQRGLGAQLTRQFEQLYGRSPYASVEPQVAFGPQSAPASYYGTIGTGVSQPPMDIPS